MAKRPDLDALIVPKGSESVPIAPAAAESGAKGYAHTLSLRMTAEQYRRLRRFVADQEERTGKRATHQAIIEAAMDEYLSKAGA
jgi:hypothetical protein